LFSTSVWSQVSNYSFAQSTGTYTSISPGTSAHAVGWDDNQTTAITLPFTFVYNGLNQTQVRIASNGFLSFGSTAPGTGNYAPISATTGYAGAVSAYGRDLIANGGIVEYTTIGLSPNRTFVVQWNNAQRYSGGAVAGDVWNFQIRLNETTNTIQIIYGTCTATSASALTGQVGLRGANNADFNNRTSTTSWAATTAGGTNGATVTSTNTNMPGSGLTYTWAPPVACQTVLPLTGGTVTGGTSVCAASSFTLNVTGSTGGASGLTYQWESSLDGTNFADVSGANGPSLTVAAGITVPTWYQRRTICLAGPATVFSNAQQISVVQCTYDVALTSATYTSIQSTGSNFTWQGTSGDDNVSTTLSLAGTTFVYQGQSVAGIQASTNGFATFNTSNISWPFTNDITSATSSSNALFTTSPFNRVLAPFWDDLVVTGQDFANINTIKYQIDGTLGSGTAVITIEWSGLERFSNPGPNLNFQVKLYETGNIVEFIYGNFQGFDGTLASNYSYTIGYNSATPGTAGAANRFNMTTAVTNHWTATGNSTNTIMPDCNTKFVLTPGVFTGPTVAPTIPAPVNDNSAGAIALTVNPAPCTSLCGTYYSTRNATASAIAQACASSLSATAADDDVYFSFVATAATDYTIRLRNSPGFDGVLQLLSASLNPISCVDATASLTATNIEVLSPTGLTPGATYFLRVFHDGAGSGTSGGQFSICVNEVILPPTNDNIGGAAPLSVALTCAPTSSPLPSVLAATASPEVVCGGTADDDVWYYWDAVSPIDVVTVDGIGSYNPQVQIFSSSDNTATGTLTSLACINNTSTGGDEVFSGSGLTVGNRYFIRIYHALGGAANGNFTVCVTGNSCLVPTAISTTNITGTSADINYTSAGNLELYYDLAASIVAPTASTPGNLSGISASPYTLGGLLNNTDYRYYIRRDCGAGSFSDWVGPFNFTTLCDGTPDGGVTASASASVCSGVSFTLNVTGGTNSGGGITWQWETSPDGLNPWTPATGTGVTFATSQTATTWYRRVTTCAGSGLSAASTPIEITMAPALSCYCVPQYTSGQGCSLGDVIGSVSLNTLNNVTNDDCAPGSYVDFTGNPALTTTLQAGGSYTLTIGADAYAQHYSAWVDYDNSGTFELSERIGFSSTPAPAGGSVAFPISLSCNPPIGSYRMRIRSAWDFEIPSAANITPCNLQAWGETEDYLISISAAVACPAPNTFQLTAGSVTTSSASFTWNVGCVETAWEIEYGLTGYTPGTGTIAPVAVTSATLTGLTPSTAYQAYVRSDCDANGESTWVGPVAFTTLAPAPANDNCADATVVTCGSTTPGTTVGATTSTGETAAGVWYTFEGNNSTVTAALCNGTNGTATFDSFIQVYTGACGGPFTGIVSNDDFCGLSSSVSFFAATGTTYRILVRGLSTFTPRGTFTLNVSCVLPPANDDCANAVALTCGGTQAGTTVAATQGASEAAAGVWYSIVGDGSTVTVSNCGNGAFDSVIEVFTGSCGTLNEIAQGDDDCGSQSEVSWLTASGVTYYVLVRGFSTFTTRGTFTLSVLCQNLCSSTQGGGTVSGPASVCSGASFTLSASNQNIGNEYTWQRRTSTTSWVTIPGETGPTLTTTQTVASIYRVRIGCSLDNINSSSPSAQINVDMTAFSQCYCASSYTFGTTDNDAIENVTLGSIDNTSGISASPFITTFAPVVGTTTTLTQGSEVSGSVTVFSDFGGLSVAVWIDFNRNGSYESSERVAQSTASLDGGDTHTFNFIVPPTAQVGTTGMRVRTVWNNGNLDPCTTYGYGETENYTVTIATGSVNDARPNAQVVAPALFPGCTNITGNLANATPSQGVAGNDLWYSFQASSNAVRIQLVGDQDCEIELEDAGGNTLTSENATTLNGNEILAFGGLTAGTQYWVAVRSMNSNPSSFSCCIQSLNDSRCDSGPIFSSLCNTFKVDWTGTANYVVRFTETAAPNATYTYNMNGVTSVPLRLITGLEHNRTYNVSVDAVYTIVDAGGNTSTVTATSNETCPITITQHPLTNLRAIDRDPATRAIGAFISTDVNVCAVTNWEWSFELVDNFGMPSGIEGPVSVLANTTSRFIRTSQIPDVLPGNRYRVRVRPIFASGPGVFDDLSFHYLRIAGTAGMVDVFDNTANPEEVYFERNTENGVFAALYPNPNNGDMVNLNLAGIDSDNVNVRIMDASGRIVWTNRYVVEGALNTIIAFDRPLTSGIYLVEMTFDNQVITERMMVTK
jgi:hypothetical protein